jgi:hypothetical protein
VVLLALGLTHDGGCGADTPPSGRNAPCTRQRDCVTGLVCGGGVCVDPDAAIAEAGAPPSLDGGADGGDASGDGG